MIRKLSAGLALGALAALIVLALAAAGWLDTAELKAYDWRLRRAADARSVNRDIALVGINDTTIRDMEPLFGHWPWPRVALSYVIDYLRRAPAKVIAVDLILGERDTVDRYDIAGDKWSGQDSDRALADSVRQAGNVIMLADAVQEGVTTGGIDPRAASWRDPGYRVPGISESRPVVLVPYQALADASVGFGHNFLVLDPDGPARRMAPFIEHDGRFLPSLGVAAALRAAGVRPDEVSADGEALRIRNRRIPLTMTDARNSF